MNEMLTSVSFWMGIALGITLRLYWGERKRRVELEAEVPEFSMRLERDAYALALRVALEDGIFPYKEATKLKIANYLRPFRDGQ